MAFSALKSISQKWTAFFKGMYNKTLAYSEHPQAIWFLASISFIESSFFPIPPDVLLIPMMLAQPKRSFFFAGICTAASVLGGFFGYAIGMFLYDLVAVPIFSFYGYMDQLQIFINAYNEYGAWIVAAGGFTPFPYKVITITSGMTGLDLGTFALASVISRGGRFFLLGALLWKFGAPMQKFIERNMGWLATLFFVLLFGSFWMIQYIG